jgi:xylan 1,4-beta-xylosidase
MMSFWTFSDVFEEGGPLAKPFVGMFGLRAKGGINKPSYYAFALLHQLGDEELKNASPDVIVTRDKDGGLKIAAWNLVDPGEQGADKTIDFAFAHLAPDAQVRVQRIDEDHGNVLKAYAAMGSPLDPTAEQVEQLNRETALPAPAESRLSADKFQIRLGPNSLALIQVGP